LGQTALGGVWLSERLLATILIEMTKFGKKLLQKIYGMVKLMRLIDFVTLKNFTS